MANTPSLHDKARSNLLTMLTLDFTTGRLYSNTELFRQAVAGAFIVPTPVGATLGTQYWNYLKSLR